MVDTHCDTRHDRAVADTYQLVNRSLRGNLPGRLRQYRDEGKSLDEMAYLLQSEGLHISRETVRKWCHRAGIDTSRKRAS